MTNIESIVTIFGKCCYVRTCCILSLVLLITGVNLQGKEKQNVLHSTVAFLTMHLP